jgi:hypothetical protein
LFKRAIAWAFLFARQDEDGCGPPTHVKRACRRAWPGILALLRQQTGVRTLSGHLQRSKLSPVGLTAAVQVSPIKAGVNRQKVFCSQFFQIRILPQPVAESWIPFFRVLQPV